MIFSRAERGQTLSALGMQRAHKPTVEHSACMRVHVCTKWDTKGERQQSKHGRFAR